MTIFKTLLYVILFFGILVFPLTATESIMAFNSDVIIEQAGSLLVTETIVVSVENINIKHGIYRDFPTRYKTAEGLNYNVSFDVINVQCDGFKEEWFSNRIRNGIRVYIGKKDIYVTTGSHSYVLTYRTKGQIGFFKDHDELYWNVTGNGWIFPIETVTCKVVLPEGVKKESIITAGYTGIFGSKDKYFESSILSGNTLMFNTTKPLGVHEGLSIVAGFNKGVLPEPTKLERLIGKLQDNISILLMLFSFMIILLYYFIFWYRYGRDPKKGVIVPRFEPPKDVSAAGMRYLVKMKFDVKTFATALVSMASKGYLTISKDKEGYLVKGKDRKDTALLSKDEIFLSKRIPDLEYWFYFSNKAGNTIKTMIDDYKEELSKEYENRYFITNYKYAIPGVILSVICVILTGMFSALSSGNLPELVSIIIWMSVLTSGVTILAGKVITSWIRSTDVIAPAIFITIISIPFFIGEVFGCYMLFKSTSIYFMIFLLLAVSLNTIFYYLLKAPTILGRTTLDEIEGFKRFLTISEKESINYAIKIDKAVYEKFLPYAMALGVENKWSEKFVSAIAVAGQVSEENVPYHPNWYTGSLVGSGFYASSFASDFSSSFSSSISASSTPPGTSSGFGGSDGGGGGGGGGGGSGGGGGGGGGGGW
ncbi:MAG: hypothetical protein A2231_12395 [Candidatus Firestonebacteria bacterium RIFOXYA2_FULL_40_8]|nr:MAG: hypothetical protein A2231_12395 [Candidatus Firestonebacteria bacterium RIFOXYA2_FULL_40_8]